MREREELLESIAFFDIAKDVFKERLVNNDLRSFFTSLLSADSNMQAILVKDVVKAVEKTVEDCKIQRWFTAAY